MKNELLRSSENDGTKSVSVPIRKHQAWFALWALILGVIIGYSVTRQNVPALIVFAVTIAAVSWLVSHGHSSSVLVYSLMVTMLIAFINPKLLAFFGAGGSSGYHWTTLGALAGFGLLAASFAAARRARGVVTSAALDPAAMPRRAVTSVDLLLTTVSKIPTFVKRVRPFPGLQAAKNRAQRAANPAEFVCRALPTPPEPIRRWPGGVDRRSM